jgi:hypothetical protein
MANEWGLYNYGLGLWGEQQDDFVSLQGFQVNTSVGNEESFTDITVQLNSNLLNLNLSSPDVFIGVLIETNSFLINSTVNSVFGGESIIVEVNTPGSPTTWGQYAYGDYSWGTIVGDVVLLGQESVTGELNAIALVTTNLLNINIGDIQAFGLAIVNPDGESLNIFTGTVDNIIDVSVDITSNLINTTTGTFTVIGEANLTLNTNLINLTIGDETIAGDANLTLNGVVINISTGTVDHIIDVIVEVNSPGQLPWGTTYWGYGTWGNIGGMDVEQGGEEVVVPSIEVDVIGQELNTTIGTLSITGNSNLTLNTNLLTVSLGDEDGIPNTQVTLSTNLLNVSVGAASGQALVDVAVTGVNMTTSTGRLFVSAWAVVNIGVTNTWTVVDIAA